MFRMTYEQVQAERLKQDQARLRKLIQAEHDKAVQRCLDSWKARGKQ